MLIHFLYRGLWPKRYGNNWDIYFIDFKCWVCGWRRETVIKQKICHALTQKKIRGPKQSRQKMIMILKLSRTWGSVQGQI